MAASVTGTPPKVVEFHKSKFWWLVTAALMLTLFVWGAASPPQAVRLCSPQAGLGQAKAAIKIIKVQIQPDGWTDWIKLPPGTAFRVNAPGWHRYQFWDGSQRVVEENETRWFGTVPASTFRLKGAEGEATIYYDVSQ